MNKRILLMGLILAITFISCQDKKTNKEEKAYLIKGDTVLVTPSSSLSTKIILAKADSKPFSREIISAGTIEALPTKFAYIAPPVDGRVIKSYIKIGQRVKKNTPLFDIFSSEFTNAQKEFFQAKSERDLALKDMKRKEDLVANGVGSTKDLEESMNALYIADQEYKNAAAGIKIYQADPENMTLGQALTIYSPIDGNIIEDNIVTGQYITGDSDPVATVADMSKVWVIAQVKEKDIRFIHDGDKMNIFVTALPEKAIEAEVFHIEESIDDETRSIKVLAVCDNADGLLRLGMFCSVHFMDSPIETVVVPETALLQDEKNSFVFVQTAANTYVKKLVEAGTTVAGEAMITNGLKKGDIVISQGGYYLK